MIAIFLILCNFCY